MIKNKSRQTYSVLEQKVLLDITEKGWIGIPTPPETTNAPVVVEDEFIDPLPKWVNPPNSLKVTVWPADALIIGRPDISPTLKIQPDERLLFIPNNFPELPSQS